MDNLNLSARRENLSEAKRLLLDKMLRGRNPESSQLPEIPRRPQTAAPQLSYAQERLWFLNRLNPYSTAYNMHDAVQIRGSLDLETLERSLNEIVKRHEILRTTFTGVGNQVVQVIAPEQTLNINLVDLQHLPTTEREAEAKRLAAEEARYRFDLEREPLLRLTALRLAPDEHILLVTVHHIIWDEWSNGVFWRELAAYYRHFVSGADINLSDLPVQYADYAYWQRRWLADGVIQNQLAYWKQQLGGELPLLQLPTDFPRPAVQSYRGAMVSRRLSPEVLSALHDLSQRASTTLFMTLLAVFQTLLFRYTSQGDIVVGTPIANRSQPGVENLIGFFLNTLVLRTDLSDNPRFMDLLERVKASALDAFAHPDLPFEKLVEELHPQRDLSYNPIFQVMFVYQKDPGSIFELPELETAPVFVDGGVSKFDLTLFAVESSRGLEVAIEYSTDLFSADTINRMLGHLDMLLKGVTAEPERRLSDLPLLTDAERHQLLVEWNNTAQVYPLDRCIHQLFEDNAARKPDDVALVYQDDSLTYRELNRRANQLAHTLLEQGVKPGSLIGICIERSPEMIVGILGVLKAGVAYVPLDPNYPAERLEWVLNDAQINILLTQQHILDRLLTRPASVICLDSDWGQIARQPTDNPATAINPERLAYVIYTSGSTGKPKGVPISHRNLVHSTTARYTYYPEPVGRFLLLSSFAFDSSVVGIFWSLCQGGTLCLPEQDQERDVHQIASIIAGYRITHTLCLPSLYALLLEYAEPEQLRSLKAVMVAGEACPPDLIRQHYERLPDAVLYNEYGPTEGTVWSTVYQIPAHEVHNPVPIGRPVSNMQVYILDSHYLPLPIGIPGELYIGGDGLASGYLNRPDLTNEHFVAHPFFSGQRLYRTGDLARYLPDGNIQFLGRADHQVKIRGYRIELEEIEAVLKQYPAVRYAVVDARAKPSADESNDDAFDDSVLLKQLMALPQDLAAQLLSDIEALSEADVSFILQGEPEGNSR